jgi:hypothetical protein
MSAQSENANATTAARKNAAPAQPQAAASRESPQPSAAASTPAGAGQTGAASGGAPASAAERLLAQIEMPAVTLDKQLLPANLRDALDAAGLGAPQTLPSAAFMALAAVGAVAGPAVRCEAGTGCDALSLRVALLAQDRGAALVPAAIMAAAFAAENDRLDAYDESIRQAAELRRAAERRRRLHEQATQTAAQLGIDPPAPLPDAVPFQPAPRPRIVVATGAGIAVRAAAAGGTGALLVDEHRVP